MGIIVDDKSRPITKDEGKAANGASAEPDMRDVRSIPTGQLIYNLIRHTGSEMGLLGALDQIEAAKKHQKLVGAQHPAEPMLRAQLEKAQEVRTIIALELDARFKDLDAHRRAACGIEIIEPEESNPA